MKNLSIPTAIFSLVTIIISAFYAADSSADNLNPADALDESKVGISASFQPIRVGTFMMGSPHDEPGRYSDERRYIVQLKKDFEMQATAVTQLQFFLVLGRNPSNFRSKENCDTDNHQVLFGRNLCAHHPVETITWSDAQQFIQRLNQIQNKHIYRLPTEAEREYAARGGMSTGFPYSFGYNDTNQLRNHAWYGENSNGRTHAVALKMPNPYGLYDMSGNVFEWVQDFYGQYPDDQATNPTGPENGNNRVVRGGSWYSEASGLRSAFRANMNPAETSSRVGFRLVRTPK